MWRKQQKSRIPSCQCHWSLASAWPWPCSQKDKLQSTHMIMNYIILIPSVYIHIYIYTDRFYIQHINYTCIRHDRLWMHSYAAPLHPWPREEVDIRLQSGKGAWPHGPMAPWWPHGAPNSLALVRSQEYYMYNES